MDVGARIKYFREKTGMTVNKLANVSGVSQSYLRCIELGEKQPTVDYLEYICNGLGITLKEFFDFEDNSLPINDAMAKLSDKQKSLLVEFIKSL